MVAIFDFGVNIFKMQQS